MLQRHRRKARQRALSLAEFMPQRFPAFMTTAFVERLDPLRERLGNDLPTPERDEFEHDHRHADHRRENKWVHEKPALAEKLDHGISRSGCLSLSEEKQGIGHG